MWSGPRLGGDVVGLVPRTYERCPSPRELTHSGSFASLFPPWKYQVIGMGVEVCRCNQEKKAFVGSSGPGVSSLGIE